MQTTSEADLTSVHVHHTTSEVDLIDLCGTSLFWNNKRAISARLPSQKLPHGVQDQRLQTRVLGKPNTQVLHLQFLGQLN